MKAGLMPTLMVRRETRFLRQRARAQEQTTTHDITVAKEEEATLASVDRRHVATREALFLKVRHTVVDRSIVNYELCFFFFSYEVTVTSYVRQVRQILHGAFVVFRRSSSSICIAFCVDAKQLVGFGGFEGAYVQIDTGMREKKRDYTEI